MDEGADLISLYRNYYLISDVVRETGINHGSVWRWIRDKRFAATLINGTYFMDKETFDLVCAFARNRVKNRRKFNG